MQADPFDFQMPRGSATGVSLNADFPANVQKHNGKLQEQVMRVFRVYQGIPGFVGLYKHSVVKTEKITDKANILLQATNHLDT